MCEQKTTKVTRPRISVPRIEIPRVSLPHIERLRISVPRIEIPRVSLPHIERPRFSGFQHFAKENEKNNQKLKQNKIGIENALEKMKTSHHRFVNLPRR